jgi:transglutaminase-like putative cysteine protease
VLRVDSHSLLLAPLAWTLTSLTLAVGLHVDHLPAWVLAAFVLMAAWRALIGVRRARLPPRALRSVAAILLLVAVLLSFRTINGVDAGTAMLTLMAGLKLLETRATRDHRILLLIAYFLVLASFLYDQQLWRVPLVALVVWLITATLLKVGEAPQTLAPRAAMRLSARVLLQATPLMLLLFLLFPRVPGPFWSLPTAERPVTGLSDQMSPGDITELSLTSEVAFRVRFDGSPPPPAQRYWRGPVLHDFDGYTWRRTRGVFHPMQPADLSGPGYDYNLMLEPTGRNWVFALDLPGSWPARQLFQTYDYQLVSVVPIDDPLTLRLRSHPRYVAGSELSLTLRRRDTRLPPERNPRSLVLARQMRAAATDEGAFIDDVLTMFREQEFFYTLTPSLLDFDSVDDFLFNTRSGFCGHYASAFTSLMRAAGIPARVVTGYQGGELNRLAGYYIVRQSDAHAWSEVWLRGRGWVRVDPTAAVAPERIERGLMDAVAANEPVSARLLREYAWLGDVRFAWDAVNTLWRERVLEFNARSQERLLRWLGFSHSDWRALGMLLGGGIALILALLGLQLARELRFHRADPVQHAYERFCRRMERHGLARRAFEGPLDFAARVRLSRPDLGAESDAITQLYLELRYGKAAGDAALAELMQRVRAFRPPAHPA